MVQATSWAFVATQQTAADRPISYALKCRASGQYLHASQAGISGVYEYAEASKFEIAAHGTDRWTFAIVGTTPQLWLGLPLTDSAVQLQVSGLLPPGLLA